MYKTPDAPICERGTDLIAFLYGELDDEGAKDLDRHLLNCRECTAELNAFKEIRSSVAAWRQATVGATAPVSLAASTVVARASGPHQPSAIAAVRKFWELSPVWMRGSLAFAAVLLCIVSVIAVSHLFEKDTPVNLATEKRYSEKEVQVKIEEALKAGMPAQEVPESSALSDIENDSETPKKKSVNRSADRLATGTRIRRGPLTRAEREQLAADLRLTTSADDSELDLLDDSNNQ
ncbi:MAG TPA: zf-HC2 domain-containing protein [Pyrinomonadaceae bacterium]|nr:zf-HC2 domain-containing protein [Pyrinomonadaceae bacterium]